MVVMVCNRLWSVIMIKLRTIRGVKGAYAAAGQAGAALHTMSVLQAYQADLLKVLDQGKGLPPEAVTELH